VSEPAKIYLTRAGKSGEDEEFAVEHGEGAQPPAARRAVGRDPVTSRLVSGHKLDPTDAAPVARIELTKQDPEPHGLDIRDGVLWYCEASSGWICRLS
jgi:hypothetical protein